MEGDQCHVLFLVPCTNHSTTHASGYYPEGRYYAKMKGFADEISAAGKPLEDEDFVTYVLVGLDQDYNSVVESIIDKEELSLGSVYS
jgi:hypothetical protein